MKKIFVVVAAVFFFAGSAFAAWTFSPTSGAVIAKKYGESYRVEITFTCDGSASGALDLNTLMSAEEFAKINGLTLRSVSVVPGTSSVAPDGAYDVNVYDSAGVKTIDETTTSEATKHTYNTYNITGVLQQIFGSVPFDIGDIGTSGDQVTLQFNIK